MTYRSISDEQILEVQEMIAMHFSNHYIHARTGLARETIAAVRAGRRKLKGAQWRARSDYNNRPRDAETVKREAQEELIRNGRQKKILLDYNKGAY
jgi:hypothetical protein